MLTLTETAANTIQQVLMRNAAAAGLRILVESGGCAGLTYRMGLEPAAGPDDEVIEVGGARLFIDSASLRLLAGATVDFVEDATTGAGFRFDNPNAQMGCSCGSSFGSSACAAAQVKAAAQRKAAARH